jgi:hypothetical protein
MRSWNHRVVRRATPHNLCSVARCTHEAWFTCEYSYVTGRAGRVGRQRRELCEEHAGKFARKNAIDMPADPSESRPTWGEGQLDAGAVDVHLAAGGNEPN